MKKIASIVSFALAATGIASGCAVDAVDGANPETVDTVEGAICSPTAQDNAVSAMFANLATTMAIEFKRMNFTRDLEVFRGPAPQYLEMLRVTAASKTLCGADQCRATSAILAFQNPAWPQKKFVFSNGTELDPWTFSARLVAGWRAQKVCEDRFKNGDASACVTEPHYFDKVSVQPVAPACGIGDLSLVTFKASKADFWTGNKLIPEQPLADISKIQRRYLWTDQDQTLPVNDNEFMRFSVSADGIYVTTDPGEGSYPNPGSSGSCPTSQYKFSYTSLTASCCSYQQGTNMWYQPYSIMSDGSGYWKCVNKP